jgi:hypothetical protein
MHDHGVDDAPQFDRATGEQGSQRPVLSVAVGAVQHGQSSAVTVNVTR